MPHKIIAVNHDGALKFSGRWMRLPFSDAGITWVMETELFQVGLTPSKLPI